LRVPIEGAHEWIGRHLRPVAPIEVVHERPWATVLRVPTSEGTAWFKACAPVQAFEVRLTMALSRGHPDLLPHVLAHDERRAWILLADAGTPIGDLGNPPDAWLEVLPRYAELQRDEAARAEEHVAHGVPDLRPSSLPDRFAELADSELPLQADELRRLRRLGPELERLCGELEAAGIPATVQHDDLHMKNVYRRNRELRVLDWGDSSIGHPFASLLVTFRFLEERNGLALDDPWFERLRDAYLEPWGGGLRDLFELALRVGALAHAIAWQRQREHLPAAHRDDFDRTFALVLRRALAVMCP
jgi:hypothetical protein